MDLDQYVAVAREGFRHLDEVKLLLLAEALELIGFHRFLP